MRFYEAAIKGALAFMGVGFFSLIVTALLVFTGIIQFIG
jgi:hypothetical protein